MVRISVIVPTYNEEKIVGKCLKAIRAQNFRDYELIVVDGHSKDNTATMAGKYADKIIFDKGRGAGAARNLAARHAKGQIVAFIDADTIVAGTSWLKTIDDAFSKGVIGMGGPILPFDGNVLDTALFWVNCDFLRRAAALLGMYAFPGNNCAYLKGEFQNAGGFREDMTMMDDDEFSMRFRKRGRLFFEPRMVVRTSVRRIRKWGYATFILTYIRAVFSFLLTGTVREKYLQK